MQRNSDLSLLEIQRLQFTDRAAAQASLTELLAKQSAKPIASLTINTKPESLNSLNGIVEFSDGERVFFKSHTEEAEQLSSYYNAEILSSAGYPVVNPTRLNQQPGQQIAFYEVVEYRTVFDQVKQIEDMLLSGGERREECGELVRMIADLDRKIFDCYERTLSTTNRQTPDAPIHQLFSHRLNAEGRLGQFYKDGTIAHAHGRMAFSDLCARHWIINGVEYRSTLSSIIDGARAVLSPQTANCTVIGHGDGHNGNIFIDNEGEQLLYFDPAFAGEHPPLLDLAKPTFHNVFARWMYFPEQVSREFELNMELHGNSIVIDHTFSLSPIRVSTLQSRITNVLEPTVNLLRQQGKLPPNWQHFLRSALFCCPLLTVNLMAPSNNTLAGRYSNKIKWLGFALAIQLAAAPEKGDSELKEQIGRLFSL